MKIISFIFIGLLYTVNGFGQDDLSSFFQEDAKEKIPVSATFKTTRLINAQTIEQVKFGELDFRIAHRFDDMGGKAGGVQTLFGFDNVTDIRLSFDYGLSDRWCIGFARSKGAYKHRQLLDFSSKYKILIQKKNGLPFSLSAFVSASLTTMKSSTDIMVETYFTDRFWHRVNYTSQLILASKITPWFSLELLPTYIHRNYVHYTDVNDHFALGIGTRIKFTKRMGVILDYFQVFDSARTTGNGFYAPLGVGLEIETGGHVFHLLFSNNKGLIESQFLTENKDNWLTGQFRLGFNISRIFNIINKKHDKKK